MSTAVICPIKKPQTKAQALKAPKSKIHEVIIIGGGPAALTAAIYTARDDIETIVFERAVVGGMPATVDKLENYPGFPEGITGLEFAAKLQAQAEKFGAKIELAEVTRLQSLESCIKLQTTEGDYFAKAVLIATGCEPKKLGVPGEKNYYARGVHYCATCDGAFYKDKNLVVVGGGNGAIQEAMFLTNYAKHIDLLVRSTLKANKILIHQLNKNPKITVHLHTTTDEIRGDGQRVKAIVGTNIDNHKKLELPTDGVFIFAGQTPSTEFLAASAIVLDEGGFIQTDSKMQTAIKGVFAAGDVRSGNIRQIACAVGDGAAVALSIREYLRHNSSPSR